ncbi:MAG: DNA polymerase II [Deltaproteobacteria bacterium]|nr:MAG: DNA polymerase II [Deltaproteobacteria bacterium]
MQSGEDVIEGFVLTRQWREGPSGVALTFWLATPEGPARVRVPADEDVMFVERRFPTKDGRRKPLELTSMAGEPVDGVYFRSRRALVRERERLLGVGQAALESDVKPDARFLMERFVTDGMRVRGKVTRKATFIDVLATDIRGAEVSPTLSVVSFDIESDGREGALYSIALTDGDDEAVMVVGEGPAAEGVTYVANEKALLTSFIAWIDARDPDILTGWNVVDFDINKLCERARELGTVLRLGRGGDPAKVLLPSSRNGVSIARIAGRVALDGIATMRSATFRFESMSLDHVAGELLGRGKLVSGDEDRLAEIQRMYAEDKPALARYNLEDARLALEIVEKARLVEFAVERQRLTGLLMDRQGGSVAAFDHLYLPRLHRHGHVAPDVGASDEVVHSPGGYVMDSVPGLHDNVLVLDFKSLYPSIIRTFVVDPMGLAFPGDDPIPGLRDATFARSRHILPELIETLWRARDAAKADHNVELSTAIKILMNSFYGVLGTPGCRFFDPRLASSITRRGHEIINEARDWVEDDGLRVIYGDTDSIFVLVGAGHDEPACAEIGERLTKGLNAHLRERLEREFRLPSKLEIEFETHYLRFFMPTMRGSDRGSKKRYAGSVRRDDGTAAIVFKGLEAVRTDWSPLARRFQRELFARVFANREWKGWAREVLDDLYAGRLDEELVYRKRLRRGVDEYERNVPPHVQAARKLPRPVRAVRYVITAQGPEPIGARTNARIDYDHYRDRQLVPAADGLLACIGTSLLDAAGKQMSLF